MAKIKTEPDGKPAEMQFSITVTEKGPYMVYGHPPLAEQFIMTNDHGESWYYQQGKHFSTGTEPTALCRCGASRNKPYCDGMHAKTEWEPRLTAINRTTPDSVNTIEGPSVSMSDDEQYCVLARFCHPNGDAWNLVERSDDPEARELAIREASMCPSGRLTAWDNKTKKPYEFRFEPSLGLIEDTAIDVSGGLWVRGRIPIRRENGEMYQIRNRVVLCRCGHSENKPYCDGAHVSIKFRDELEGTPEGETSPEAVV